MRLQGRFGVGQVAADLNPGANQPAGARDALEDGPLGGQAAPGRRGTGRFVDRVAGRRRNRRWLDHGNGRRLLGLRSGRCRRRQSRRTDFHRRGRGGAEVVERLRQAIHDFGGGLGMGELVAANALHALVDVALDAGAIGFAGRQAEQDEGIGRPGLGRDRQPGADEFAAHAVKMPNLGEKSKGTPHQLRLAASLARPRACAAAGPDSAYTPSRASACPGCFRYKPRRLLRRPRPTANEELPACPAISPGPTAAAWPSPSSAPSWPPIFWGLNFTAIYPVLNILGQRPDPAPGWIDGKIDRDRRRTSTAGRPTLEEHAQAARRPGEAARLAGRRQANNAG